MPNKGRYTFFGTSASMGIPVIGCTCAVCLKGDKKDIRTRPSGLLEVDHMRFLIDAGPDLRAQFLYHKVSDIDGLILTHTHYDHVAGIDELRVVAFRKKTPIPILASSSSIEDLKIKMSYLFKNASHRPDTFSLIALDDQINKVDFCGLHLSYIFYTQEGMQVTGYRIGDFAFITDIKEYDKTLYTFLEGVQTLVLSAIGFNPSKAHISIREAQDIAEKSRVKQLILTHIHHELAHLETMEKLPENVQLAYDGMIINFNPNF